jgi:Domain of unknown function (DUF4136)
MRTFFVGTKFLAVIFVIGMFLSSSVEAQKVEKDYDRHANFSQYHTFMWLRAPKMHDPLMAQRVVEAVNAQLTAKGWQQVSEGADVGIVANGATQQQQTLDTFYNDFPGWRWRWGVADATTTVTTYTVGTLVVDLFDAKTKQAIFRATASDTLSDKPEKNADKLNKAVERMFRDFPPEER